MTSRLVIDITLSHHWPNTIVMEMKARSLVDTCDRAATVIQTWTIRTELKGRSDPIKAIQARLIDWIDSDGPDPVETGSLSVHLRPASGFSPTRRRLPRHALDRLHDTLKAHLTS